MRKSASVLKALGIVLFLLVGGLTALRFFPVGPAAATDTNGDGKPDLLRDCRVDEFPWSTKLSTTCRYRKDENFDGYYDTSYLQGCFGDPYNVMRVHEPVQ